METETTIYVFFVLLPRGREDMVCSQCSVEAADARLEKLWDGLAKGKESLQSVFM